MTPTDLLNIAREMQAEYYGQAARELAPTHQFALNEKGNAMGEFIQRVKFKLAGER